MAATPAQVWEALTDPEATGASGPTATYRTGRWDPCGSTGGWGTAPVDGHGVVREAVLANLTTMLETGEPLPVFPWGVSTG